MERKAIRHEPEEDVSMAEEQKDPPEPPKIPDDVRIIMQGVKAMSLQEESSEPPLNDLEQLVAINAAIVATEEVRTPKQLYMAMNRAKKVKIKDEAILEFLKA